MKKVRIIPRLDVKGPNVVKGIQLEGLRVVGNPAELARRYYEQGADEILYIDIVASLYNRNNLTHIVEETTEKGVFIPITVGGGIRTIDDITKLLRSGADKVAINTAAINNPQLLKDAVAIFGSSTIVLSIEAKKVSEGKWEAYTDNGREKTGRDVIEWVKEACSLGIGEVLLTSVDKEGSREGYDVELTDAVSSVVTVPLIVSGGFGKISDFESCLQNKKVDGLAVANLLHYDVLTVDKLKTELAQHHQGRINENYQIDYYHEDSVGGKVSIVDYGVGNLHSIRNAFRSVGAETNIISKPEELQDAEYLVLPGVGAFEQGMKNLRQQGLDKMIVEFARSGKPILGICLGMQLLMTKSFEFGEHDGLNIIEGEVLPFVMEQGGHLEGFKIPHVGWNAVSAKGDWSKGIFHFADGKINSYFVHSFYVKPQDEESVLGVTKYFDYEFCSIVGKNNTYGCQFHPEKKGPVGLNILREFLKLGKVKIPQ